MTDHLVITCGGTGGHFYPGFSIDREQIARGKKFFLLLSGKNSIQQSAIAEKYHIPCQTLPNMPSPSLKRPGNCWRFLRGLLSGWLQAKKILKKENPSAVLGMGSFASLPVIWAAKSLKLPIFLHDGNARIGKANRFLSRYARALGTAFPAVNSDKVHSPCTVIGMPLRPELKQQVLSKAEAIRSLNEKFDASLEEEYFTVLLFGGSQGARKLNEVFGQAVKKLSGNKKIPIQLIHLTGPGEYQSMIAFHAEAQYPVLLLPSLEEMHWAYQAADLVVSRSGGSSAAELIAFGKYAVLVPYPFAAEHHQDDNADYLLKLGAAVKLNNNDLAPDMAEGVLEEFYLYTHSSIAPTAYWTQLDLSYSRTGAWDGAANMLELMDDALEK